MPAMTRTSNSRTPARTHDGPRPCSSRGRTSWRRRSRPTEARPTPSARRRQSSDASSPFEYIATTVVRATRPAPRGRCARANHQRLMSGSQKPSSRFTQISCRHESAQDPATGVRLDSEQPGSLGERQREPGHFGVFRANPPHDRCMRSLVGITAASRDQCPGNRCTCIAGHRHRSVIGP